MGATSSFYDGFTVRRTSCSKNSAWDFRASEHPRENASIRTNSAYGTSNKQGPGRLFGIAQGRVVLTLIRHARRRFLSNELLSQGANAFSAALIAFILLLLFGTEFLGWQWLAAIPAAAAGWGIARALKRTPAPYQVAQLVDRRLELTDTLSTAYFFHQESASRNRRPTSSATNTNAPRSCRGLSMCGGRFRTPCRARHT